MSKITTYRILITSENKYFEVGKIIIKTFEGDILYVPSQRDIINTSQPGLSQEVVEHISWHKSGRVHIKTKTNQHSIIESGEGERELSQGDITRQEIKDIGFQEMIRVTIVDFSKMPQLIKPLKEIDVIFDIGNYFGPVQFIFSVVSGRLIVAKHQEMATPLKELSEYEKSLVLSNQRRCLGNESGNADKLLQYILCKYVGEEKFTSNQNIFIPKDLKINREIPSKA